MSYRADILAASTLIDSSAIDSYVFTGSSLHDELEMLVDAGLSPLAALQTATINPARFAELEQSYGSVEVGKQADLLLLRENPLLDISATRDINALLYNGAYYDRRALLILDAFGMAMSKSIRFNLRYLWNLLSSPLMRVQLAD